MVQTWSVCFHIRISRCTSACCCNSAAASPSVKVREFNVYEVRLPCVVFNGLVGSLEPNNLSGSGSFFWPYLLSLRPSLRAGLLTGLDDKARFLLPLVAGRLLRTLSESLVPAAWPPHSSLKARWRLPTISEVSSGSFRSRNTVLDAYRGSDKVFPLEYLS